jgi:hypothetical protein
MNVTSWFCVECAIRVVYPRLVCRTNLKLDSRVFQYQSWILRCSRDVIVLVEAELSKQTQV